MSLVDTSEVVDLATRRPAPDGLARLSADERLVLALMCQAMDDRRIASELLVPLSTVAARISRIYAKLGIPADPHVHPRVSAVLMALGLLHIAPAWSRP